MQSEQTQVDFFESARLELPPNFGVTAVPHLLPDVIAPGTIHNAICSGVGPAHQKVNGKIVLERNSFLDWLQNRPRAVKRIGKAGHGDA